MDNGSFTLLLMVVAMGGLFWFQSRMQKKQASKRDAMLASMRKGNEVITIGGLHGLLDEVNHDNKTITLDCEGIFLTFEQWAIREVKETVAAEPEVKTPILTDATTTE